MSDDDLITLPQACESFFAGKIKVATLRAEAARGRLTLFRIGRRDFTTRRDLRRMVEKCRVEREAHTYTSTPKGAHGQSETEAVSSAQAAAKASVERLKLLSRNTSVTSIARPPALTR
jgi:hypothetical protein